MTIRETMKKPYWAVAEDEKLPGHDFCREIVEPGTNETFPDGAVGIRVDDDFWAVAALPYEFKNQGLREIVKELWPWPACAGAIYCADSGTLGQRIEQLEAQVWRLEKERDGYSARVNRLEAIVRRGRYDYRVRELKFNKASDKRTNGDGE